MWKTGRYFSFSKFSNYLEFLLLLCSKNAHYEFRHNHCAYGSKVHSSSCKFENENITEIVLRWIIEGSNGRLIIRDFDRLSRDADSLISLRAAQRWAVNYIWKINNPPLAERICSAKRNGRAWRCYPNVTRAKKVKPSLLAWDPPHAIAPKFSVAGRESGAAEQKKKSGINKKSGEQRKIKCSPLRAHFAKDTVPNAGSFARKQARADRAARSLSTPARKIFFDERRYFFKQ